MATVMGNTVLATTAFDCTQFGLVVAAALVAGRGFIERVCAALFVACSFVLAWLAPGSPISRGVLALVAVWALMATIKIASSPTQRLSIRYRVVHLLSLAYPIRAGGTAPVLSLRVIGHIFLEGLIGGFALLTLLRMQHLTGTIPTILRLATGVVLLYTTMQLVFDIVHFYFSAAGVSTDSIHRTPIAARSLREFWGQRWNRAVSAWLYRFVFLGLARRQRPALGLFCAFLVSGAMHAWIAMVAVGASAAFAVGAFFVLQGAFVLAEDRLHVRTWPTPVARAWTLLVLLASSPLFIGPALRILGL